MISPTKITRSFLALLTVLGSMMVALAAPAAASTPSLNISTFKNRGTGLCLNNVASTSVNGSYVLASPCQSGQGEEWFFAGSNQVSPISNGVCLTSDIVGNVSTVPCASPLAHTWFVAPSGGVVRDEQTGLCLENVFVNFAVGFGINTAPCSENAFLQDWIHSNG